jgi:hypothetical protein
LSNSFGINPGAHGTAGGAVTPNANGGVTPHANVTGKFSQTTGGIKGSRDLSNSSGIIPVARGTAGGGVAPNANVGSGRPSGNPSAPGSVTGANHPSVNSSPSSPPIAGQSAPVAPVAVQGISAQAQASSRTGLAVPAEDGISTKIVPAKPCSTAARETDGSTTCVGIPSRR